MVVYEIENLCKKIEASLPKVLLRIDALEAKVEKFTAYNSAIDAIARITWVLDDASSTAETKVSLINIIVGQQHQ